MNRHHIGHSNKELTVAKWVLIVRTKIPKRPQKVSAKMSAQAQKLEILKKLSLGVRSPCTWCMEFTTCYRIIFWWSILGLFKVLFYTQYTGNMAIAYLINVNRPCAKQWKLVKAVSFALNYLQKNVKVGFCYE